MWILVGTMAILGGPVLVVVTLTVWMLWLEELFVPSRVQLDGAPPDDPVEHAHRRTLAYMLYA